MSIFGDPIVEDGLVFCALQAHLFLVTKADGQLVCRNYSALRSAGLRGNYSWQVNCMRDFKPCGLVSLLSLHWKGLNCPATTLLATDVPVVIVCTFVTEL